MQVGNLVRYNGGGENYKLLAIVTKLNTPGGTVRAIDAKGNLHWLVSSYCEVVSIGGVQ